MRYYFLAILTVLPVVSLAADVELFQERMPLLLRSTTSGGYIEALYSAAIGAAAIIVVLRLIWVGVQYMLTESVISKRNAKGSIQNALIGLLIILGAVTILTTINPNLLNLNVIEQTNPVELNDGNITFNDKDYFIPGEVLAGSEIATYCANNFVGSDSNCANQYTSALEKSCLVNGGSGLERALDPNVSIDWYGRIGWSWNTYRCLP